MIVCIDIGGTSLKVAVENNDELLDKDTLPVREDFDSFVQEIVRWIKEKQKKYDIEGIAFSAPGAVDVKSGIIGGASAIPYIHGPNFKEVFKVMLIVQLLQKFIKVQQKNIMMFVLLYVVVVLEEL